MEKHKNEFIKRTKRRDNFVVIGNEVIQDSRMTIEARGVLVYLLSLPQDWVIRKNDLQKRLAVSRRTIDRCFEEMKQCGYLCETDFVKKDGKFDGKGYLIYDYSIYKNAPEMYSTDAHSEQRSELTDVHSEHRTDAHSEHLIKNTDIQQRTNNTGDVLNSSFPINQGTDNPDEMKKGGGGGPAAAKSDVEKAKDYLKESMLPYKDKYSREMLNDFFLYWTEGSQKSSKIRYQSEKFFDVGRRLATWANNNKKKFGEQTPVSKPMHNIKFNIQ